jgi:hypothetical protein
MKTKMKEANGKVHLLRFVVGMFTATFCDKTFKSKDLQDTDDEVNCSDCLLATIKRKEVIRRP